MASAIAPRIDGVNVGAFGSSSASVQKGKVSTLGHLNIPFLTDNCFVIQDASWMTTSAVAVHERITGIVDYSALHAGMGLSSFLSLGVAAGGLYLQGNAFLKSKRIGDVVGQFFAAITATRFVNTFLSGVTGFASKMISISQVAGTCRVSQAAFTALGQISGACGTLAYSLMSILFAARGVNALIKFNQLSGGKPYDYLKKELELSSDEVTALAEIKPDDLPKDALRDVERNVLTGTEQSVGSTGYQVALARKKLCKEAAFKRTYGKEALKALKDSIAGNVGAKSEDEIVAIARAGAKEQGIINILWLVASAIAITAFALSVAGTGGATLLAGLIISLVAAVAGFSLDSYDFIAEWKKGDFSQKDKIIMGLFSVVIAAMTVVSSVFSAGLVPLLIASVGGGILLISQIAFVIIASKQGEKTVQKS